MSTLEDFSDFLDKQTLSSAECGDILWGNSFCCSAGNIWDALEGFEIDFYGKFK